MCRSSADFPPHGKRCENHGTPAQQKARRDTRNARRREQYRHQKTLIKLQSPLFGEMEVTDGDLSNVQARSLLISGLCGTLAKSIHQKTGADIYLVMWDDNPEKPLTAETFALDFQADPTVLQRTTHMMVGSQSVPGNYMDAFGHKTLEDVQDFYGKDVRIIKGTADMLDAYDMTQQPLPKFAEAVLKLDADKHSYDYKTSYDA